RQCDDLGNVLLGNLGSCIYVDVTLTCTTYLNIVANQVHTFMAMVFPDGSGLFQRDNASATLLKMFRNGLRNMTKSSRCRLGLQIPQISIQPSICGICWKNKTSPWMPHFTTYRT
ncbi:hypothetical protein LDENG_00064660, partial [Lucifuga dentata]